MPDWALELIKTSPAYALLAYVIWTLAKHVPSFTDKVTAELVRLGDRIEADGRETRAAIERGHQSSGADHEILQGQILAGRCRYGHSPEKPTRLLGEDEQPRPGEYRAVTPPAGVPPPRRR
jgi:hypothetical protein